MKFSMKTIVIIFFFILALMVGYFTGRHTATDERATGQKIIYNSRSEEPTLDSLVCNLERKRSKTDFFLQEALATGNAAQGRYIVELHKHYGGIEFLGGNHESLVGEESNNIPSYFLLLHTHSGITLLGKAGKYITYDAFEPGFIKRELLKIDERFRRCMAYGDSNTLAVQWNLLSHRAVYEPFLYKNDLYILLPEMMRRPLAFALAFNDGLLPMWSPVFDYTSTETFQEKVNKYLNIRIPEVSSAELLKKLIFSDFENSQSESR